jgi:hypothetical protein
VNRGAAVPPDIAGPPPTKRERARAQLRRTRRLMYQVAFALVGGTLAGWLAGAYITLTGSFWFFGFEAISQYAVVFLLSSATIVVGVLFLFFRRTRKIGMLLVLTGAAALTGLASWVGGLLSL